MDRTQHGAASGYVETSARASSRPAWRWFSFGGSVNAIPEADGLRAVAVLLVMVFHAWYFVPGLSAKIGSQEYLYPTYYLSSGVQLFFVLSGFLLFLPYARWLFGLQRQPSWWLFYKRRLLRVGPAYWTNLLILALATPITVGLVMSVLAHAVFLHNVFVSPAYGLNSVYWTMAVEVQFYVALPAIAWAIAALGRRIGKMLAGALILGGLTLISLLCAGLSSHSSLTRIPVVSTALVTHYGLPFWLSVFSAGMACSLAYVYLTQVRGPTASIPASLTRWSLPLFASALLAGVAVASLPVLHYLPAKSQVFGWVFAAMLLSVVCGSSGLRKVFASRLLRFIGLISYSLYLWHLVVLLAIEPYLGWATSVLARSVVGLTLDVIIAIPLAYLSFRLTERPFFQAREHLRDASAATASPIREMHLPAAFSGVHQVFASTRHIYRPFVRKVRDAAASRPVR